MILKQPRYKVIRKKFIINFKKKINKNSKLRFGICGIKSLESGFINYNEVEALRKCLQSIVKYRGFLYTNIVFNQNFTKKSVGSRMGKGKGSIESWSCFIVSGTILFELDILYYKNLYNDVLGFSNKLSLKTKVVFKDKKY